MSRSLAGVILAAAFAVTPLASAQAFDNGLVRIEPRAYYGAVVTVEHGVRVYRPLPTQRLMIINPDKTPVNISFTRTIEHKAAEGGSESHGSTVESDSSQRYGGISGLGNGIVGTNPQYTSGQAVGVGGHRSKAKIIKRHAHR